MWPFLPSVRSAHGQAPPLVASVKVVGGTEGLRSERSPKVRAVEDAEAVTSVSAVDGRSRRQGVMTQPPQRSSIKKLLKARAIKQVK